MQEKQTKIRFVKSNMTPFLSSIVFIIVFYLIYFLFWNKEILIDSAKVNDFAKQYWIYIPFLYWILIMVIIYILCFLKWILRLNFWIVNLLILLTVFWFNLIFWIQLFFYEPRYTNVAIYLIDTFSKPLIFASTASLLFVLISIFIKKKFNS
jgi:hypothetical protein